MNYEKLPSKTLPSREGKNGRPEFFQKKPWLEG
jgi:hypothetical protein